MVGGSHPTRQEDSDSVGPSGRRSPSRGFLIGIGAVVMFALLLAAVGAIAAQSPSGGGADDLLPLPAESPIPFEVTVVPPEVTPDPDYTGAIHGDGEPDQPPEVHSITAGIASPESGSSTVQAPRTAASSWSAGPTPVPPAPAPAVSSDAVSAADGTYGVRIVTDGQDWGPDAPSQEANIQAVISAIDRLPDTVMSAVVAHAHGPLAIVSNDEGRTLDGWQPYGGYPMAFYTNSDQGLGGYHASNQVVISVGATNMSVGHEILHAYQFRNVGPDEYALALLQPEMRSFMEAVGWRQTGSDEEVRQAVDQPWSAVDSLYVYEGRALTYVMAGGDATTISAANPIEAFAIAGSIYYTRPAWMPLPQWPDYWAWFSANLG